MTGKPLQNIGQAHTGMSRFRNLHQQTATKFVTNRITLLTAILGVSLSLAASPAMKRGLSVASGAVRLGTTPAKHHWFQIGKASWYGGNFNGRKTASGETYDMNGLTCAHRTLPLGSWIEVTNLLNRKSAFVRVTDRGPAVANHIVDLSYAAAQRLGMNGLAKVKIEPVNPQDKQQTQQLIAQLSLRTDPVVLTDTINDPKLAIVPEAR